MAEFLTNSYGRRIFKVYGRSIENLHSGICNIYNLGFVARNGCQILTYFVCACSILVSRIVSKGNLEEAHRCLLKMVKLIEEIYGSEKITPNLYLCLHICECVMDYGPLYAFWCFSYERMNGLLGKFVFFEIAKKKN